MSCWSVLLRELLLQRRDGLLQDLLAILAQHGLRCLRKDAGRSGSWESWPALPAAGSGGADAPAPEPDAWRPDASPAPPGGPRGAPRSAALRDLAVCGRLRGDGARAAGSASARLGDLADRMRRALSSGVRGAGDSVEGRQLASRFLEVPASKMSSSKPAAMIHSWPSIVGSATVRPVRQTGRNSRDVGWDETGCCNRVRLMPVGLVVILLTSLRCQTQRLVAGACRSPCRPRGPSAARIAAEEDLVPVDAQEAAAALATAGRSTQIRT